MSSKPTETEPTPKASSFWDVIRAVLPDPDTKLEADSPYVSLIDPKYVAKK
jgi:hypothetical protein